MRLLALAIALAVIPIAGIAQTPAPSTPAAAAKSYEDAAVDAVKAGNNALAIELTTKALALNRTVNALYIRAIAYTNTQDYLKAIADLEIAQGQAKTGNSNAATLNAIAERLVFAYNYRAVTLQKAGDTEGAVSALEAGAKSVPSRAVGMYVQAANILAAALPPDWKRVKAEADKALAINADDATANYVAGVALANARDPQGAIVFLRKAKANVGADASLAAQIDAALQRLGGSS